MTEWLLTEYGIAFAAALVAGGINALAGGGTLVSFPALVALGIPPVSANITNTIALCPGYFGGIWAQRSDVAAQKKRLITILPVSILGGITGGLLLVHSDEEVFRTLIPYLILSACLLLAVQSPLRNRMTNTRRKPAGLVAGPLLVILLMFFASVYGGYFGAGVSVILLALLGLLYDDPLPRLNGVKQAISFSINVTAAVYFIFSGMAEWMMVPVMCVGSLAGGWCGGRVAGRISPDTLRWTVVAIGMGIACWYLATG